MSRVDDFVKIASDTLYSPKLNESLNCVINSIGYTMQKYGSFFEISEDDYEIFIYDDGRLSINDTLQNDSDIYVIKKRISFYEGISHFVAQKKNKDKIIGEKR